MADKTETELETKESKIDPKDSNQTKADPEVKVEVLSASKSSDQVAVALKALRETIEKAQAKPTGSEIPGDIREQIERMSNEVNELQSKAAQERAAINRKGEFDVNLQKHVPQMTRKAYDKTMDIKARAGSDIEQLQQFNDDLYLTARILGLKSLEAGSYLDQHLQGTYPDAYAMYKHMETGGRSTAEFSALDTGAAWIPTGFSNNLVEKVRVDLRVAALHDRFNLPTDPYVFPVEGGDMTAYTVAERTGDDDYMTAGNFVTASSPTAGKLTFSTRKVGVRTVFSTEITEDSIIAILPHLQFKIARALAEAQENAVINGDLRISSSHLTGVTPGATSQVTAYDGYRRAVQRAGSTSNIGQAIDASGSLVKLRKLRSDMGKYGISTGGLVYVVSINGYHQMLGIEQVITIDKFGSNATILNGQIGSLDGIPIVISDFLPDDLDSVGLGTGGTKTEVLLVNRSAFRFGDRREITVKSKEVIETDQHVLVALQRLDFKPLYKPSTSDVIAAAGVNVTLK